MKRIRLIALAGILLSWTRNRPRAGTGLEGPWKTTNRKLDGIMTCVVRTATWREKIAGAFYGVWQGVPFDYAVPFSGPASKLQRAPRPLTTRVIRGQGKSVAILSRHSRRHVGSSRHIGSFEMQEKPKKVAVR